MTIRRPPLRYYGSKWRIAPWVIRHLPLHRFYTDSFGGGASILLRKPRSHHEVYNDLSLEVVNLFRVLQHPDQARELQRLAILTPYARAEFDLSYTPSTDPVEQARRTLIRAFFGHGGAGIGKTSTGFRAETQMAGVTAAMVWAAYPAHIAMFTQRLRGVCLENRPAIEVIRDQDGVDCLHYVDPPYPKLTRSDNQDCYTHEMSDDDHRELADVLHQVKGMVVLSGYPCALYDQELFPGWLRIERKALADGGRHRTEVLWLNPAAANRQQQSMDLAS